MPPSPVAFVPHTQVARARRGEGALSGLSFAAKDLFDIRGHVPSAGHPAWAETHAPAVRDAPVIERVLAAGADLVGVTIMDELAYGLSGQNIHYGTPTNARAPSRLCGGSSSGSAAAVAACLCDFALGTDTGGSIRVPASFCGLFGLRPSHGAIPSEGVVPLAPSFDTVGFLARDAETFQRVASVFFALESEPLTRVLFVDDAFARADAGVTALLTQALSTRLAKLDLALEHITLGCDFMAMRTAFRRLQGREMWTLHGAWITEHKPTFSPPVAERIAGARALYESGEGHDEDQALRASLRLLLAERLTPGTLLCMPAAPGIAPRLDDAGPELDVFRARTLELTSLASLTGFPQLVVPAVELSGAPLGLSFMAARGADAWLLSLAAALSG